MAITMDELAQLLGVSRGTVDRALNGRDGISARTKQRVLDAAREHGYVPHYVASSLATGRSQAVGIIVFDLLNRHFSQMVNAAESRLMQLGIFSYVCISEKDKQREKSLIGDLAARRVDGILLLPINEGEEFVNYLKGLSLPIVTVSNRLGGDFHFVGGDGSGAVYRGMSHFLSRGYRKVHFVCPPLRNRGRENMYAQLDRAEGYRAFMADHPEAQGELIASADYLDRVVGLIRSTDERQGFFCSSDHYALKVLRYAHGIGLESPDRFALMGFDGVDILDCLDTRPTTVFYPAHDIGECAANTLYGLIQGAQQPMDQLLDCPLLPGETA